MSYYLNVWKNYVNFNGRARRKEYWMFVLFNLIIACLLLVVSALIGFPLLYAIYVLAVICPSLAVCVRRLHDIGKSGAWFFVTFVPVIGAIWLLVLLCKDSEPGENLYGSNPKNL